MLQNLQHNVEQNGTNGERINFHKKLVMTSQPANDLVSYDITTS